MLDSFKSSYKQSSNPTVWCARVSQWFVVKQTSYNASVNVSGPATASPGQTIDFRVDMYLPGPVTDISFEALTPVNSTDSFNICNLVVVSAGQNFACYPYEQVGYVLCPSSTNYTNRRATLSMHLVNTGKSFIKVQMVLI
jgi:hypothetical protein